MDWLHFPGHKGLLVIIRNLDVEGIAILPRKADSPLVIDPNAVLLHPIATQPFQAISWNRCQRRKVGSRVQHNQFPQSNSLDGFECPASAQQE